MKQILVIIMILSIVVLTSCSNRRTWVYLPSEHSYVKVSVPQAHRNGDTVVIEKNSRHSYTYEESYWFAGLDTVSIITLYRGQPDERNYFFHYYKGIISRGRDQGR